jgi:periplasmic divalent cation tolerance protein
VVSSTLPSEADASRIAEAVVQEGLAACAQVIGPVRSTFRWRGALDHASEWYLHCKTTGACFAPLADRIRVLHPYDVPEIIATPILDGHPPYLRWIEESVSREP